ncbi:MAG: [FeFe] hydrogenase H-cluster maturation GTPase HydF [Lachnospiraceae bacterium]
MSLNATPSGERIHIGFFGRRNAGKSSLVNAVTGQDLAVVSDTRGTTTDPVSKSMELLPLGPVLIIDTPGFDDEGMLGELRIRKTKQVLNKTDIAVLVVDTSEGMNECDRQLLGLFEEKQIPYLIAFNKSDLMIEVPQEREKEIYVSAVSGSNIYELKEKLAGLIPQGKTAPYLVKDLLKKDDIAVLVTPIDESAPKGRMILPQQMMIREVLDADAVAVVTRETQFEEVLKSLGKKPAVVITDSQVFGPVAQHTPPEIPLTSFSILMARHKGFLADAVRGVMAIENLQDGDTVLISEGCTHHRQCGDIGSVKLPAMLKKHTGKNLNIRLASGTEFPEDLSPYAIVLHCGGCMLNDRELQYRMKCAVDQGVPMTNYGIAMAYMRGILKRSVEMLPEIGKISE